MKQNIIKLLSVLFILFFASISHNANAQKIKKTKGGYVMGSTIYLKNDMVNLFKDTPDALLLYEKAKRQNSFGNVSLSLSGAITVSGVLMMRKGRSIANQKNNNLGEVFNNAIEAVILSIGGLLFISTGVSLLTISLVSYAGSKSNYKKALREYNWSEIESVGYKKDKVFIETSVTGNGVSMTYNF